MLILADDKFPPYRSDVRVLYGEELAQRRGHTIDWILQSNEPCARPYETEWMGCNVKVGAMDRGRTFVSKLRKQLYDITNDLNLFHARKADHYDFIVVKDKFLVGLLGLIWARVIGARMCFWLSYPFPEMFQERAECSQGLNRLSNAARASVLRFLLYRLILPRVDHVFVQSEQMKADVAKEGITTDKMTAIPMGVPRDLLASDIGKTSDKPEIEGPIILYLGTLVRDRRLDFLLRVIAKVRKRIPDAKLVMVGDGDHPEDRAFLEGEAIRIGLGRGVVIFTGFVPMEEGWRYVRHADVCVSTFYPTPTLLSTSPTKVVEYLALGRPVVANDHPDQSRVLGESQAGLCVPYDEDQFTDAVVRLLENTSLRETMGQRGPEWVRKNRSYEVIAADVEQKYLGLCSH